MGLTGFDAGLDNAEDAGQVASALKEDATLLEKLSSAEATDSGAPAIDLKAEVAQSAFGNLEKRFENNPDQVAKINEYKDRAEDLAFVLNSDSVKGNADVEAGLLDNLDKLDSLLDLTKVLEDDPAKMEAVYQNLDKADDLKDLTNQFRFEQDKLDTVFGQLDKVTDLKSLSDKYKDDETKLDALFANTDKLDGIKDLSNSLGAQGMDTVFENLDHVAELQTIANQYEGEERTAVLDDLQSLSRIFSESPEKKKILFENPDQLPALKDLTEKLSGDSANLDVGFANAEKADAFLSTYDDIEASGS